MARKKTTRKRATKTSSKSKSVKRKTTARKTVPRRSTIRAVKIPDVPVKHTLNPFAFGYAFAILRAAVVLLVSIVGSTGKAQGFVAFIESVHFSYSLSLAGVIAGIAETAAWGLVLGYAIAWLYNRFV